MRAHQKLINKNQTLMLAQERWHSLTKLEISQNTLDADQCLNANPDLATLINPLKSALKTNLPLQQPF
jgi:hypothetical protein